MQCYLDAHWAIGCGSIPASKAFMSFVLRYAVEMSGLYAERFFKKRITKARQHCMTAVSSDAVDVWAFLAKWPESQYDKDLQRFQSEVSAKTRTPTQVGGVVVVDPAAVGGGGRGNKRDRVASQGLAASAKGARLADDSAPVRDRQPICLDHDLANDRICPGKESGSCLKRHLDTSIASEKTKFAQAFQARQAGPPVPKAPGASNVRRGSRGTRGSRR